jgi:protein CrcB
MVDIHDETPSEAARDEADLARFGYKQELRRTLGVFSSFAVAFSYISPSTGIFALFFLGLTTIGGVFFWSWPIVALGQFIIALTFAELSSHYPVAGSVFQWTKYLSGKTYSWFAGWIYLFAGILTVSSVCVTLPLALIPAFNGMGWNVSSSLHNQRIVAIVTLAGITILNIFGVRLVALINNTGVNLAGVAVLAWVATRLGEMVAPTRYWRLLIGTGFCGALTTFSTFQVETIALADDGHAGLALAYASASVAAGMILSAAATIVARRRRYG